jgi:uncharacterized protein YggE
MNRSIISISFIAMSMLLLGVAMAENPMVSVVGKGVYKANADITIISVGVESNIDNQTEAEAEVQAKLNRTIDALIIAGLKKDDILQSNAGSFASIQSKTCSTVNNTTTCSYSNLSQLDRTLTVQMKTVDQSKINRVMKAAKDAGANASIVGYTLSDPDKAMSQALKKAEENAKAKAEAYASGEGYRLGKLIQRDEVPAWLCSMDDLSFFAPDSSSEPGTVNVRACVEAAYELLP